MERPVYGLTKNIHTFNPFRIAFHEFAAIARDMKRPEPLRTRLARAFRNPAWKPPEEKAAPPPPSTLTA